MATDLLSPSPTTGQRINRQRTSGQLANGQSVQGQGGDEQGDAEARGTLKRELQQRELQPGVAPSVARDFLQLTKPGIVMMILVTTMASAIIGGGVTAIGWFWLLMGTALVAGSAGAANQVWERQIDRHMKRTSKRPLPDQRMQVRPAILFTAASGMFGFVLLAGAFGAAPAWAAAATWLLYVLIYTPLKTRTAWNTTIGAVAGALPMLIGYTAAGGGWTDLTAWLLVGLLAAWQYPHFMAIAWVCRDQYADAGFCMTTTVDPSGRSAGWQSIAGSLGLIACGVWLCWIPGATWAAVIGMLLVALATAPMLLASARFAVEPSDPAGRSLLRSSLIVLPAVLAVVTLRVFW